MSNYFFKILFCLFLMGTGTVYFAFADDLPSAKDPAARTENVREAPKRPQLEADKAEDRFEYTKKLKTCTEVLRESRAFCRKKLMAECRKSTRADDCRKALR